MEKQETSVKSLQYLLDAKVAQVNFDKYQAEVTELQEKFRKFEQHVIAQDAYNKRQNILIHGYEEKDDRVWKTRNETLGKFYEFLNNGLKFENHKDIKLSDRHRLPQHPLFRNGTRVNRPIIVKLSNIADKSAIFKALKNLKAYNDERVSRRAPVVCVTEHLPAEYQQQRKSLMPIFNQARKEKRKTSWRIVQGEYSLFVDNYKICPITI